jgi:hypothetical protein
MKRMNSLAWSMALLALAPTAAAGEQEPAYEDFSDESWASLDRGGVWEVIDKFQVHQKDEDKPWKNNAFNKAIDQGDVMTWAFDIKVESGARAAGIYVMASDPEGVDRGTSYLLWYSEKTGDDGERHARFSLAKFIEDKRQKFAPSLDLPNKPGEWVRLQVRLDTTTGEFLISCDGEEVGKLTDPDPIKTGEHVSLHTMLTPTRYRNLEVTREKKGTKARRHEGKRNAECRMAK